MRNPGEARIEIPWPVKGLVDDLPFSHQPPGTTREAMNVRSIDPKTGRTRGGQRSGLSRWNADPVNGSNKIQDLATVLVDDRLTTYSLTDPATDTIESRFVKATEGLNLPLASAGVTLDPNFSGCLGVQYDRQGNSYWLDGRASVAKYNPDGVLLYTIALPVADSNDLCRAFHVDDLDFIFVGVSGGRMSTREALGPQETARLFCYLQEPDNEYSQLWMLEPGAYIEQVQVQGDKLYTAQNDLSQYRSYIRVYRNIDSSNPVLDLEREVSFPVNDITLNTKGDVFFTSPTFSLRGSNPLSEDTTFASEDWRYASDLEDDEVLWSYYRADAVQSGDVVGDLDDNPGVLIWKDLSGNGRHFYYNTIDSGSGSAVDQLPPTYRARGLAGKPCIAFDGDKQSMVSLANPSVAASLKDAQRTAIPGYTGGMYAMVIVARLDPDAGASTARCLLYAKNDASGASDHYLIQNAAADNTPVGGTFSSGDVSYYADTDAATPDQGAGTGGHLLEGTVDTATGVAIISIIWDGGVDLAAAETVKTRCTFRVNGEPYDRCGGEALEITDPIRLGHDPNNVLDNFKGEIYEIVVFSRQDDSSTSEQKILDHPRYPDATFAVPSGDTTALERVEGELAHRYGVSHILAGASSSYPHPYGLDPQDTGVALDQYQIGPPNRLGTSDPSIVGRLAWQFPLLGKIAAGTSGLRWVAFYNDVASNGDRGGIGFACAANSEGDIYTYGPSVTGTAQIVRKVKDLGDDYSLETADGAWFDNPTTGAQTNPLYEYARIAVDAFDNVYIPGHFGVAAGSGATPSPEVLIVYDINGTAILTFTDIDTELGIPARLNAVAVDPVVPEYGTGGIDIAEWVGVAAEEGTLNIANIRMIEVAAMTGSSRSTTHLAVSGGNVYKVTPSTITAATNGTGALASGAKYIQSVSYRSRVYFADGQQYKVYNPITDAIESWTSTSPGGIPQRNKLIEVYGGRIVLAGDPDDPTEWYMSAIGDPGDFDFYPPVPEASSAVRGSLSRAELAPDIITGLIPYSDDILIFGMDSCIYVLRGNPNDGGVFDRVSQEVGMAFGRAWAIDDHDNVFFMGRKGGVYLMQPGSGRPQRITRDRIDRRFQDFDFEDYYIRAFYNRREEGIHWFAFPFAAGGTSIKHWFHDTKNDAWWEDEFGKTAVQPTAALIIDGDEPTDRVMILGCEDGRLRLWDEDAATDDDVAMDSRVLFGPFVPSSSPFEYGFSRPTFVLARDQGGARLQAYAQNEPDKLGAVRFSAVLGPGRNAPRLERMAGSACWYRLGNGASERWAYESGSVMAWPLAHARPR